MGDIGHDEGYDIFGGPLASYVATIRRPDGAISQELVLAESLDEAAEQARASWGEAFLEIRPNIDLGDLDDPDPTFAQPRRPNGRG